MCFGLYVVSSGTPFFISDITDQRYCYSVGSRSNILSEIVDSSVPFDKQIDNGTLIFCKISFSQADDINGKKLTYTEFRAFFPKVRKVARVASAHTSRVLITPRLYFNCQQIGKTKET